MRTVGTPSYIPIPMAPDCVWNVVLVAGTAQAFSWATSAQSTQGRPRMVMMSGDCNFFVKWDSSAAAVPAANIVTTTSQSTGCELNPTARQLCSTSTGFGIVSPTSGIVSISFYLQPVG